MNAEGFGHGWADMPHASLLFCLDVGNRSFGLAKGDGRYPFYERRQRCLIPCETHLQLCKSLRIKELTLKITKQNLNGAGKIWFWRHHCVQNVYGLTDHDGITETKESKLIEDFRSLSPLLHADSFYNMYNIKWKLNKNNNVLLHNNNNTTTNNNNNNYINICQRQYFNICLPFNIFTFCVDFSPGTCCVDLTIYFGSAVV